MNLWIRRKPFVVCAVMLVIALLPTWAGAQGGLSGTVKIDGSSTVFPISEAVAEEFQKANPGVRVTVGLSGTGGGFKKFSAGEIDISGASRPIKSSEGDACDGNGVKYIELPVAFDGLSVVVNKANTWCKSITVAELKKMWEPAAQGKITTWKQIRAEWPDQPLNLFGPGTDSGTFDYFTGAINGKEKASRGDYTASEDDNVLVFGVQNDKYALGYFGYAYYLENKDSLNLVAIDDEKDENGKGPILPTHETIANNTYQPLARPIFIYVKVAALERPEVKAFCEYYLSQGRALVDEVGYIPFSGGTYDTIAQRLGNKVTGTMFGGKSEMKGTLDEMLKANASSK